MTLPVLDIILENACGTWQNESDTGSEQLAIDKQTFTREGTDCESKAQQGGNGKAINRVLIAGKSFLKGGEVQG